MLHQVTRRQNRQFQNLKQPRVNYQQYLLHQNEPGEHTVGYMDPEVEKELIQNRFFLKKRVWRSARKFRKTSAELLR
jgi:hypothetical protein